jgi:lipopolysaccharide transport system ATP-binding protein
MAAAAIEIAGLGKRYRIRPDGGAGARSLREDVAHWARSLVGSAAARPAEREMWAVREISLQVPAGQLLGLVGHNGAGKSTLLRMLARITAPTEGEAVVRGRVASLLELGAGFHLELTGRENVYLSAAVLGMSRERVHPRLDAIAAMAGVGDYLDVPVKRYSSGMFVRLGFAVAAHLEPDVLLVDELLAVGDADFRAQCLQTLQRFAREGRTVVLVSHDAEAVAQVCERVVYMAEGRVAYDGVPGEALRRYQEARPGA